MVYLPFAKIRKILLLLQMAQGGRFDMMYLQFRLRSVNYNHSVDKKDAVDDQALVFGLRRRCAGRSRQKVMNVHQLNHRKMP